MKKNASVTLFAILALVTLIIDSKTALAGAQEGISLCINTVIPSLFPFLFISALLANMLTSQKLPMSNSFCRLLGVPKGAEHILLLGFLGGYPVGAQTISDAVQTGFLSRENGKRMLAFCSNAGPAFIFGIGSTLFEKQWLCWVAWAIQITSALIIGLLIPVEWEEKAAVAHTNCIQITGIQKKSLQAMAGICGWVVLFRTLIRFCRQWFLWLFPAWIQCVLTGTLELTNGCISLQYIADENLRFILFSAMLSFGGLCVTMQTYSVCQNLNQSLYIPGKLGQTLLSTLLAIAFISREIAVYLGLAIVIGSAFLLTRNKCRKKDSIPGRKVV